MNQTCLSHAGIDLDVICINDIVNQGQPAPEEALKSDPGNHRVFVNAMFKKMKGREAFLSFSRQISDVNKILTMAYSSASDIARVILRDLALTSQVLRLVNSSFYRHFARKGISTISEAMIILGTDQIRGIAASLKIYEMMKDLAGTQLLKDKTLKGLQRSIMARQLAEDRGEKGTDVLPVSAMIYDLGEYLVALFDPQRYIEIELKIDASGQSRDEASKTVLGISYSDLGRVMAAKLNLPEAIVRAIHPVSWIFPEGREPAAGDLERYLCALIYELCEIPMDEASMDEAAMEAAAAVVDKYGQLLDIDLEHTFALMEMSHEKMLRHADLLKVAPVVSKSAAPGDGVKNKAALKEGLKQIQGELDSRLSIHEIFTRIAAVMDKSFYFDHVVISIRKKKTHTMEPRFARGKGPVAELSGRLAFKIDSASSDLFNRAIKRKADIVVRDLKTEARTKKVPRWYLDGVYARRRHQGFAVFPVFVRNNLVAMIYIDWDMGAPELSPATMDYVNVFRELMVKTFTLHSA